MSRLRSTGRPASLPSKIPDFEGPRNRKPVAKTLPPAHVIDHSSLRLIRAKLPGLNAPVIHCISAASSVHASNGCPSSNLARPAHPPPPYRGRSFGYLWLCARCRAGRRGGLTCGEGRGWRFQGGGGRLTLLLVRSRGVRGRSEMERVEGKGKERKRERESERGGGEGRRWGKKVTD